MNFEQQNKGFSVIYSSGEGRTAVDTGIGERTVRKSNMKVTRET
jgi:hypothetical protein